MLAYMFHGTSVITTYREFTSASLTGHLVFCSELNLLKATICMKRGRYIQRPRPSFIPTTLHKIHAYEKYFSVANLSHL